MNNGLISLSCGDSTRLIQTGITYTPDVWTHYALVRKDGVFTMYRNGVSIGTSNTTYNVNLSNFSIGGNSAEGTAYKGYISNLAVYSTAKWSGNFTPPAK